MSQPYMGELRIFSFNYPPRGWALCNGQLLPINQNPALFQLLGTNYGGNGSTNFGLPNLQSRVPLHQGDTAPGALTGAEGVTLNTTQIPTHTHPLRAVSTAATTITPVNNALAAGNSNLYADSLASPVQLAPGSVSSVGSGQAHENRQPYLVLSVCIAIVGVFPSRN